MAIPPTTQIVKIDPGECIILPSDAIIQGVTQFNGGVAESECVFTIEGTKTYYFFVDQNPAEEGDQAFCLVDLTIGTYVSTFPDGCNRVADQELTGNTDFINTVKSNPVVLELRGKNYGGSDNKAWSITVPASAPAPFFHAYETNDSDPWQLILPPLTTDDVHYSTTVTDLSDPGTIL